MAKITVTTFSPRASKTARGLKAITGAVLLSTTSQFPTSGIEKYFKRCHDIQFSVNTSATVGWTNSATRLYGLATYFTSASSAPGAAISATFFAIGF